MVYGIATDSLLSLTTDPGSCEKVVSDLGSGGAYIRFTPLISTPYNWLVTTSLNMAEKETDINIPNLVVHGLMNTAVTVSDSASLWFRMPLMLRFPSAWSGSRDICQTD